MTDEPKDPDWAEIARRMIRVGDQGNGRRRSWHDSGQWMDLPDGSRLQLRKPGAERMNDEPVLYPPWDWTD